MATLNLTPDQSQALAGILEFINTKSGIAAILYAAAGCGKTFLTRVIADATRNTHRVAGVAPTHKARKVLHEFLNATSERLVDTLTVASLLNTARGHSYVGTKRFERGKTSKMDNYDLYLIDEASMITDTDVDLIINYATDLKKQVLFIGDRFQIPNPSQRYKLVQVGSGRSKAVKRDSKAFDLPIRFELTTIVRQQTGNPLIKVYAELRDAIKDDREPVLTHETEERDNAGVYYYTEPEQWREKILAEYQKVAQEERPIHKTRVLVYTNDKLRAINDAVRRLFNRGPIPEAGELLMGYGNVGWPNPIIENSQDYYVVQVKPTNSHILILKGTLQTLMQPNVFGGLVGNIFVLQEAGNTSVHSAFVPDLAAEANQGMLVELVRRAQALNKNKSTKTDFKNYIEMKNFLVIMESIYFINGEVLGENKFRKSHSALYRLTSEVIVDGGDGREPSQNKITEEIQNRYPTLISDRIGDDKPITSTERMCDRFCIIERELDYGYCITAHKAQGSSFDTVFIDDADFEKLRPYWSTQLETWIDPIKEKNQLRYVCYTRPKVAAHVLYVDPDEVEAK